MKEKFGNMSQKLQKIWELFPNPFKKCAFLHNLNYDTEKYIYANDIGSH